MCDVNFIFLSKSVHGENEEAEFELARTLIYVKGDDGDETPYKLTDGGSPFFKGYHVKSKDLKIYVWDMKVLERKFYAYKMKFTNNYKHGQITSLKETKKICNDSITHK